MLPFRIKICGLTDPANVRPTVEAGAQALGLNFYPKSKRYIDSSEFGKKLIAELPSPTSLVGVFVNAPDVLIAIRCNTLGLNFAQLHGEETVDELVAIQNFYQELPHIAVPGLIKAFRLRNDPETEIGPYLDECKKRNVPLAAMLIDAYSTTGHGGTGERADWAALGRWTDRRGIPLILAGGITPENVAEAIATVRPDAIDTASGVETSPGIKDPAKVQALVQAAETAWKSQLSSSL